MAKEKAGIHRILIITYTREVNPGTFLQCFGVQYSLHILFPKARIEVLKHTRLYNWIGEGENCVKEKKDIAYLKGKLRAIPRRLKYEFAYRYYFHLSDEEFDFFKFNENDFQKFANSYDLIVVGSDTILNVLKKNGQYGLMWLLDIDTEKILFSASAMPAKILLSEKDKHLLSKSLSTFKLLSVRDNATQNLLLNIVGTQKPIIELPDPTLSIPDEYFKLPQYIKSFLQCMRKKKKIALVNFGNNFIYKMLLTRYLREKGYYTISTIYNRWSNRNFMTLSPFQWGAVFDNVDLVVTERFHDSVFALRKNKPVITIDWDPVRFADNRDSKTSDLLTKYEVSFLYFRIRENTKIDEIYAIIDNVHNKFSEQTIRLKNELFHRMYFNTISKLSEVQ